MHALAVAALFAGSAMALFPKMDDPTGFGATWWLNGAGEAGSDIYIVSSNTTLQVPPAPSPQVDRLAIWPGMETTGQGLVQSIIVSFANPAGAEPEGCGGQAGQWCVFASFYTSAGQQSGQYVPVSAGDMLDIDYIYDDASGQTVQYVSRAGQLLSTFTSSSGRPDYYDCAVECQAGVSGNMPAHSYFNTQIVLNEAYPDWPSTLYTAGSSDSGMSTPDGGKTWVVQEIDLQSYPCTPS